MEALWATILFSGFALEVIIRPPKTYDANMMSIIGKFLHDERSDTGDDRTSSSLSYRIIFNTIYDQGLSPRVIVQIRATLFAKRAI